jgi:hypothetical protein
MGTIMTMRRLFAVGLVVSGLSIIPWVRADNSSCESCCEPIAIECSDDCSDEARDDAMSRYRCNQSRHWRQVLVGGK